MSIHVRLTTGTQLPLRSKLRCALWRSCCFLTCANCTPVHVFHATATASAGLLSGKSAARYGRLIRWKVHSSTGAPTHGWCMRIVQLKCRRNYPPLDPGSHRLRCSPTCGTHPRGWTSSYPGISTVHSSSVVVWASWYMAKH